jgi:hypothetical protein
MSRNESLLPTAELDALCRFVERTWPGVLAAYDGFSGPRLRPEDCDCIIEVFFVPWSREAAIIRGTYPLRKRLRRELNCHVSIICHNEEDSATRYSDDVSAVRAAHQGSAAT